MSRRTFLLKEPWSLVVSLLVSEVFTKKPFSNQYFILEISPVRQKASLRVAVKTISISIKKYG